LTWRGDDIMRLVEAVERLTDEVIALLTVVAAIAMLVFDVDVPQWFQVAFAMVIAFYFRAAVQAHGGG